MRNRVLILAVGLLSCLFAARAGFAAAGAGSPILLQKSQSEFEVDLGMIVEDLLPPLLETMALEDKDKAAKAQALADLIGVRALDRLHMVSAGDENGSHTTITVSMDPAIRGGLLSAMLAAPPGEFRFARYVRPEDALLVASLENFAQGLAATLRVVSGSDGDAPSPFGSPGGDSTFAKVAAAVQETVAPLLSGELDVLLFPANPQKTSKVPPIALVLGSTDGMQLRDRLFDLVAPKLGEQQIAALEAMPQETVGEFAFYTLPMGWSYAVSRDFLVISTEPARLKAMLAKPAGALSAPPGRQYMRVDGQFFVEMLNAKMNAGDTSSSEARLKTETLEAIGKASAGAIEISTTSDANHWMIDIRQQGSTANLQYAALREILTAAPRMKALDLRKARYHAMVAKVDAAMTRYGEEHSGVYPKKVEALVTEGYLDALPDLKPTPLGKYVEGGYTYVPLRDEDGVVRGYFYFAYGVDPNGGYDMLTPGNVEDPAHFVLARDGKPDGIVEFSYEGMARPQVGAWSK